MSVSIPDLCEELKPYVGRSERTDLGIMRKEAFQRFAIAADIDHLPEWHGAMTQVEVLERDDEGRATVTDSEMDATVTRVVYVHEFADARRRNMRRSRMSAEFAGAMRVVLDSPDGS